MQAAWPWQTGVLDPQGPIGAAERTILLNSTTIMLAVIVPVIVLTLAFAWWFRAGNEKAIHLPDWSYSGRIEVVVWSIPTLIVGFLGGIAWLGSHDLDPRDPIPSNVPTVNVQVVSMDWKWLFIYPDQHVASVNRLVVPAGAPIQLPDHFGDRYEQLFRAGARQHDLRDVRDDHSPEPAGRSARDVPGPLCAVQRRWVRRHAFRLGGDRSAGL